jgi:hypothetical protein
MKDLYRYLTYAGSLPFIICAGCIVFGVTTIPILGGTNSVLGAYALIITSFMAGSHWGQHTNLDGDWNFYLPIASNVIAITVWVGFLILPFNMLLFVCAISFTALLYIDKQLFWHDHISVEYFVARCHVTLIVVVALITSGVFV